MSCSWRKMRQQCFTSFSWFAVGILVGIASVYFYDPSLVAVRGSSRCQAREIVECETQCSGYCSASGGADQRRGDKGEGGKYRHILKEQLPPEMQPGYIPENPEEPVSRLPKALILGFAKCGTAALVTFLPLHPDIVAPNWEVNYFCDQHYFEYDLFWYRDRMPLSYSHQITIEKSPCYIMDRQHFERMKAFNSSLKLMITVRNPLDLLMSKYGQMVSGFRTFGKEITPVEDVLLMDDGKLDEGFINRFAVYVTYVKEVYEVFPKKQIMIIDGDNLIQDPLSELKKIETFLGIQHYFSEEDIYFDEEKGFFCYRYRESGETQCLGKSKGRKHETIDPKLNETIRKYLKPFNEELYKIVGRKFSWD